MTRVLFSAAEILRDAGERVCLLSGESPPDPLPGDISCRVIPGLGYAETASESEELLNTLDGLYQEGDIWHVHNHSLGKNPVVSDVFLTLAERGQLLVLQPHDFAEDGRPQNLDRLRREFPGYPDRLYPVAPHVQYAVLQQRDKDLLKQAGIPHESIHLLPNPIPMGESYASAAYPPRRVLYLTRAIRRKNIGEFLYWASCFQGEVEFATSLIPENPVELKRFQEWQAFAEQAGIRVQWGIGEQQSFQEVVEWSDACITTSVGEGFGMSFLEPFAMGRPVLGRNLPEITAGFIADGIDLSALYSEVPVAVDMLDENFWSRAQAQVQKWRKSMGSDELVSIADLKTAWEKDGDIDFGRLDETAQRAVLQKGKCKRSRERLQLTTPQPLRANVDRMKNAYGVAPYLQRLQKLYAALSDSSPLSFADGNRIRDAFLDIKHVRLLRT